MHTDCGRCLKYSLFIVTFTIMVCGLVVFGIGVWTLVDRAFMERFLGSSDYRIVSAILIAAGATTTVTASLGCSGAINETRWMLLTFFLILFLIFALLIAGAILSYVCRDKVPDIMKKTMLDTVPKYINETAITDAWDAVQTRFKCCGLEVDNKYGYEVWQKNPNFTGSVKVPKSCCKGQSDPMIRACQALPSAGAYDKDCFKALKEFLISHGNVIGGIVIGIACILIIGMGLSCAVFQNIR